MLCGVVMQAYILGTLFHYLVKRDPKLEAFRCAYPCPAPLCLATLVPVSYRSK